MSKGEVGRQVREADKRAQFFGNLGNSRAGFFTSEIGLTIIL